MNENKRDSPQDLLLLGADPSYANSSGVLHFSW